MAITSEPVCSPTSPACREKALLIAYTAALAKSKSNVVSDELTKEKLQALKDPEAALSEELNGFSQLK